VLVSFRGKIRLAKGFIHDLYIHMGCRKASAFGTVLDLSLKGGRVVEILDRSKEMEQKRGAFKKHYESGDRFETIEEAFSLNMDWETTCQHGTALHGFAPISMNGSRSRKRHL
jgi:hypothetical protein